MSDLNVIKAQKHQEKLNKQHFHDLQKAKAEHRRQFEIETKKNKLTVNGMRQDFETEVSSLKNETEQKLTIARNKQKITVRDERERLEEEITNMKLIHKDQVSEIKQSQTNQIEQINTSHKKTLEDAKQNYLAEKMKWDV